MTITVDGTPDDTLVERFGPFFRAFWEAIDCLELAVGQKDQVSKKNGWVKGKIDPTATDLVPVGVAFFLIQSQLFLDGLRVALHELLM